MKIIVDQLAVNYLDNGAQGAPVLLMLHGWGTSSDSFDKLIQELSKTFRVIALDFPGFGRSESPREIWGVSDYARFLKIFMAKVDLVPLYIIAHSFGGRVAIKSIAQDLVVPSKLVLIASAGIKEPDSISVKMIRVMAKIGKVVTRMPGLKQFQHRLRTLLYGSIGSTDYLNANTGQMRASFLKVIKEDLRADAAMINLPTLLIYGDHDTETPSTKEGKILHQSIPGSRMEVIENAGHFVFQEKQEAVLKLIVEFLQ